ncbi:MAG: energy transducer TonB [Deltaproteobacteria bacterium]|nr:energy transducer TonB [Deltaproteobacteria bacterium]
MNRRQRWARVFLSLLLAVLVNGAGMYLVIQVNKYVHTREKKSKAVTKTIVLREQHHKKHRTHVARHVSRMRNRAVPMPLPNLPSNISSEQLMPDITGVDLLGDLMGRQQGLNTELVLKEEAVDEPPRVIRRVAPDYPSTAEDRGIEGYVIMKLQVSAAGRVEKVWVEKSDPPGIFEKAATRAIRQYQFAPAKFKGQAVAVLCRQKILFKLEK